VSITVDDLPEVADSMQIVLWVSARVTNDGRVASVAEDLRVNHPTKEHTKQGV
jgi:hypothetical protein